MTPPPPPVAAAVLVQCPACRSPLQIDPDRAETDTVCPVCSAQVHVTAFSRLTREFAVERPDAPAAADEAACSFYPELRAKHICDECGCFLSERAAVDWAGHWLCLPCLHRLREKEGRTDFVGRARLPDRLALALVTWGAPLSLFTAPLALFLLLRHRGKPAGFVPRGRAVWWIALFLSVGWIAAWLVLLVGWIAIIRDGFL